MAMLERACTVSGITPLVDAISADQIGVFKTDSASMTWSSRIRSRAQRMSFQSSNRWDVAAAERYGFRSVWINRTDQPDEYRDHAPAMTIRSLSELAN